MQPVPLLKVLTGPLSRCLLLVSVRRTLNDNALSGTLPTEWRMLQRLRVLSLASNDLQGPLPPAWSSLANLETLALNNNQLSGPVPPSWGTGMRSLTSP